MNRFFRIAVFLSAILATGILFGCGVAQDAHNDNLAITESIYDPGEAVSALGYAEAQPIDLYIMSEGTDDFEPVSNGDYVSPGTHTLGIFVSPRLADGKPMEQRVFLSDGGWDWNIEASFDENSGLYVCDLDFPRSNTYLTYPILIQVIYPDEKASKEKFVVTTKPNLMPKDGNLVDQGIGITLGAALLGGLKDVINPMIGAMMPDLAGLDVKSLNPAVNSDKGVLNIGLGLANMDATLINTDIALYDTYNETRELTIGIEYLGWGENIPANLINLFLKLFGLKIPIMPLGFELQGMIDGLLESEFLDIGSMLGGSSPMNDSPIVEDLLGDLEIETEETLLLNIFGLPDDTDENFAAIGGALYTASTNDVKDEDGNFSWPDVVIDSSAPKMYIDRIKSGDIDLGIALSQYNLNQVLKGLARSLSITIGGLQNVIPLIGPEDADNSLDLVMKLNPGGIALDMKDPDAIRVVVNGASVKFVEAGQAKADLSADLCLKINVDIGIENGEPVLHMEIIPVEELCHLHVMKDDMNLGLLDHSELIMLVFNMLGVSGEPMAISLPLSTMGIITPEGDPGWVDYDGMGNCFMGLAVESLDLDALPIDISGCFISTAGY